MSLLHGVSPCGTWSHGAALHLHLRSDLVSSRVERYKSGLTTPRGGVQPEGHDFRWKSVCCCGSSISAKANAGRREVSIPKVDAGEEDRDNHCEGSHPFELTTSGGIPLSRRSAIILSLPVSVLLADWKQFDGFAAAAEVVSGDEMGQRVRAAVREVVSKPKAAGVLRLVFHDAGTFNVATSSGGMNGSILFELNRPENSGLKRPIKVLEKVRESLGRDISEQLSWADLIAVAGAEAVAICGGPNIPVAMGRVDATGPDREGRLPPETLNAAELKLSFNAKGFSMQEMVVLSGAHTLGSKGFGDPVVFDNTYYASLLTRPWESTGDQMMQMIGLPTDRALAYDDEALEYVQMYAADQSKFFDDFSAAYQKMVRLGAMWRTSSPVAA